MEASNDHSDDEPYVTSRPPRLTRVSEGDETAGSTLSSVFSRSAKFLGGLVESMSGGISGAISASASGGASDGGSPRPPADFDEPADITAGTRQLFSAELDGRAGSLPPHPRRLVARHLSRQMSQQGSRPELIMSESEADLGSLVGSVQMNELLKQHSFIAE